MFILDRIRTYLSSDTSIQENEGDRDSAMWCSCQTDWNPKVSSVRTETSRRVKGQKLT